MSRQKVPHLTDTQVRILRHIRETIAASGDAPTVRELAASAGLRPSTVHYQLGELAAKGAVTVEPRRHRGVRLA
ncbi:LexA family protein [Streptomyces zhihengii]|uniref:Helix-turn-helix domain-containing protein n=1 Tax=Streptomyces zhihengii TaxID=1818004 RepID=A0ABS2V2U0_9ACTN|nr:MarR family transcriptional regulator [Streptomyces zhihengii]MBM9623993.1 helix-turn-helix domain-containing protein [Streptomyces zhihengii]